MHSKRRLPWLKHALGAAVSACCLIWILVGLDFEQIGSALRSADYRTLPVMLVVLAAILTLNAWRWTWLLRPLGRFRVKESIPPLMIGLAMNNVLPARLGELVRVDTFCRRQGTPRAAVLAGIALERVFDVVVVLGFLAIGLVCIPQVDARVHVAAWWLGGLTVLALALAGTCVMSTARLTAFMNAAFELLPFMPQLVRSLVDRTLVHCADGLGVLRSRTLLGRTLCNTAGQWGLAGLQMMLALYAFGIQISPALACLLVAVVAIGVTIPSAPGYIGVIQALFVFVINKQTVGPVDQAAVFGASIYYHATQYLVVTVSGLLFLSRASLSLATMSSLTPKVGDEIVSAKPHSDVGTEFGRKCA